MFISRCRASNHSFSRSGFVKGNLWAVTSSPSGRNLLGLKRFSHPGYTHERTILNKKLTQRHITLCQSTRDNFGAVLFLHTIVNIGSVVPLTSRVTFRRDYVVRSVADAHRSASARRASEIFEVDTSPRVYEWVINYISHKLLQIFKMWNVFIGGSNVKCNNFWIRKALKKFSCHPKAFYKWKLNDPFFLLLKYGLVLTSFCYKMKELHYKIIHIAVILYSQNVSWTSCTFCNSNLETISHLFFECDYAKDLWKKCLGLFSQLTTNFLDFK